MSLIARYKLDGNAKDSEGTAHGTAAGVTWAPSQLIKGGKEARLDGTTGQITLGLQLTVQTTFSLIVWVRPHPGQGCLIAQHDGTNGVRIEQTATGEIRAWINGTSSLLGSWQHGEYHRVFLAYDQDVATLYLDGAEVGSISETVILPDTPLLVGNNHDGSEPMACDVVDVEINDAVAPPEQSAVPPGFDVHYTMDNVAGSTLYDETGGYNATIYGATQAEGIDGQALEFSGNHVDTGYRTNGGDYTIAFWMRPAAGNNNAAMCAEAESTNNSYGLLFWLTNNGNTLTFGHFKSVSGDYDPVDADFAGYVDRWVHVAAVRKNGQYHKIFIDGVEAASGPCSATTSTSTNTLKLGGNVDYISDSRHYSGRMDGFYAYPAALNADKVMALRNDLYSTIPFVLDENFIANDECVSLDAWSEPTGDATVVGSEIVYPAGSASYPSSRLLTIPTISPGKDFLIYFKIRQDQASGRYAYLQMENSSQVAKIHFILNYNWPNTTPEVGTVSVSMNGGNERFVLETGIDTSVGVEYVIHIDVNRSAISFYKVTQAGLELKGSGAHFSSVTDIRRVKFNQGSGSGDMEAALDYLSFCYPNFVSIGDSIAAGHNHFDPSPSFYPGIDNVKNSWQGNMYYAGLRNGFVVNKGIGSQDSGELLARIGEATNHNARYIFLQASNNDYGAAIDQANRTDNIQASLTAIKNSGARGVLLNALYPNANHPGNPANAQQYLDWWNNYRPTLSNVYQAIDINQPVIDSGTGYIDAAYCETDGIHPNEAGYIAIGTYVEQEFSHVDEEGSIDPGVEIQALLEEVPVKSFPYLAMRVLPTDQQADGYNPHPQAVPNPTAIPRSGRSQVQGVSALLAPPAWFDQRDGSGGSHLSPAGVVSRPDRQGRLRGNITDQNGQPVSRRVRCFERRTGRIVREIWSNAAGYYQFDDLDPGKRFTVVAHDYSGTYNAVIADNAQPEVPA